MQKYRVWDKGRKKMSLVVSIHFGDDGSALTVMIEPAPKRLHVDLVDGENAVLMQWTGSPDQNGREIYQGDIVRAGETLFVVVDGLSTTEVKLLLMSDGEQIVLHSKPDALEVVGNTSENPELLPLEQYQQLTGNALKPLAYYEQQRQHRAESDRQ